MNLSATFSLFSHVEEDIGLQGDSNGVGEQTQLDGDTQTLGVSQKRISPKTEPMFAQAATQQGSEISLVN